MPEHDRVWYHTNLRDAGLGSVLVGSDTEREQAADVLREFNPLDLHDETTGGIGGADACHPQRYSSMSRSKIPLSY